MHTGRLPARPLGNTGLSVSIVGLGAEKIGGELPERDVEELLHGALDAGVTLIDTAVGYGRSEERLGRVLHQRRGEYVLSTKGGYYAPGLCDQRSLSGLIPEAVQRGLGVLGKRPLANRPWSFAQCPRGDYAEVYWERFQAMGLADLPELDAVALRFSAFTPGVSSVLVGTSSLAHLQQNLVHLRAGPLPAATELLLRDVFAAHDQNWEGQI